jgi:hypothetical protein
LTVAFLVLAIMRSKLRYAGAGLAALLMSVYVVLPAPPAPDLVIYEDGTLVGLVDGKMIATTRGRPQAFILEQWQRALIAARHVKPLARDVPDTFAERKRGRLTEKQLKTAKRLLKADLKAAATGRFTCRKDLWCVARARNGARIVQTDVGGLAGAACDLADMVITPARLSWRQCHSGAALFTASTLRRTGTVEIRFDPLDLRQFRTISAFGIGGRPWYDHRVYDWRSGQFVR